MTLDEKIVGAVLKEVLESATTFAWSDEIMSSNDILLDDINLLLALVRTKLSSEAAKRP